MENKTFYTFIKYIKENKLTISEEDYIEMIYRLCLNYDSTRIKEIAQNLNVKPSSASTMVKKLQNKNYVEHSNYGVVKLSKKGKETGKILLERHKCVEEFLCLLDIKEKILEETEKIEHTLNLNTIFKIKELLLFFNSNPIILKKYKEFQNSKNN